MIGWMSLRMLQVEDAQARVLDCVRDLGSEPVAFHEALGRVLREDVMSPFDAPEADNSAMDGYAVRAEDIANAPVTLRVTGEIPAGTVATASVEPGTAMRIMTGALVPAGADTVVQVELTDGGTEMVSIQQSLPSGANIRRRGEDLRTGAVVLRAGTPIHAAEVAVLASVQRTSVPVGRRPVVAILPTGDELVDVDQPRTPGKVVNSNAYALAALVAEAGGVPRVHPIVRDTREATIAALDAAVDGADFLITTGGVSVGAWDFVKDALDALGAETKFWQVAMKPGKPVVLSTLRERVVFGLPGNPVSCMVSFHLFVAPAIRKAMGRMPPFFAPTVNVRLTAPLKAAADRRVYFRVRLTARDGELLAEPMTAQGSGVLTSMLAANGLAVVQPGASAAAGSLLPVVVIGEV